MIRLRCEDRHQEEQKDEEKGLEMDLDVELELEIVLFLQPHVLTLNRIVLPILLGKYLELDRYS
jgi:hypothetical protein